jgi:hypothetical protein
MICLCGKEMNVRHPADSQYPAIAISISHYYCGSLAMNSSTNYDLGVCLCVLNVNNETKEESISMLHNDKQTEYTPEEWQRVLRLKAFL